MLNLLWALIYKVFIFVLIGTAAKRFSGVSAGKAVNVFIWICLYLLIPAYIFLTMWSNSLSVGDSWKTAACALLVVLCGAFLAWAWSAAGKISFKAHCLPVIFMNSAYLAIPVNTLLWGARGAAYAIVYNVAVTIANFTLGIWWASEAKPLAEITGLPVLYAVAAGAALNFSGVAMPRVLEISGAALSFVTLPAMLIFAGYRLGEINTGGLGLVFWGVFLRMFGGFLAGTAAVYMLGITGPAAGVCIMSSSMPAAVYSYILTEKYKGNAAFAAAAVFAGTVLSFFTIAALGYYYR